MAKRLKKNPDLSVKLQGEAKEIAVVRLTRAAKRNALSDGLIYAIRDVFQNMPESVRAAVLCGEGEHFCAGIDLSELKERDAAQGRTQVIRGRRTSACWSRN